jgi:tripartite-type tricarboxylate transporter receptor subunit TctC
MMRQLQFILFLFLAGLAAGCNRGQSSDPGNSSSASSYPSRSITLICPWAAGGGTDRVARFFAEQLQKQLGKPVIVVNKTGGSGAVGHSAGGLAAPDGYTITMGTFELSTMHWMGISELTWTNFAPIMQVNADAAALIVKKDAPWKSLPEFLQHVKKNPGAVKMSGTATGGAWDLARSGLLLEAGLAVNSVIWVPTQGSAPSIVELLGGHIDAVCCSVPEAAAQIDAGQLRVLAVMSPERLSQYPQMPTTREQGVDWTAVGWRGLLAPRSTPPEIIDRLHRECRKICDSAEYKTFMDKNGFAIAIREPEPFARFLEEEDARWQKVIAAAGYVK